MPGTVPSSPLPFASNFKVINIQFALMDNPFLMPWSADCVVLRPCCAVIAHAGDRAWTPLCIVWPVAFFLSFCLFQAVCWWGWTDIVSKSSWCSCLTGFELCMSSCLRCFFKNLHFSAVSLITMVLHIFCWKPLVGGTSTTSQAPNPLSVAIVMLFCTIFHLNYFLFLFFFPFSEKKICKGCSIWVWLYICNGYFSCNARFLSTVLLLLIFVYCGNKKK